MNGAHTAETAFTTCPAVSELESMSPFTTLVSSGFKETCRMVLPIPKRTQASIQLWKLNEMKGIIIPMMVMTLLSCTVFLRPILFMSEAVGTLSSRNQMKIMEGMNPARVSLRLNSCFA